MSIDELLAIAKKVVIGDTQIDELKERLANAEQRYEEEDRARSVDSEFMSRVYSL